MYLVCNHSFEFWQNLITKKRFVSMWLVQGIPSDKMAQCHHIWKEKKWLNSLYLDHSKVENVTKIDSKVWIKSTFLSIFYPNLAKSILLWMIASPSTSKTEKMNYKRKKIKTPCLSLKINWLIVIIEHVNCKFVIIS
jgi:hypothetical protein